MEETTNEAWPRIVNGELQLTEWQRARIEHLEETDRETALEMLEDGTFVEHLVRMDRECEDRLLQLLDPNAPGNAYILAGATQELCDRDPARYYRLIQTVHSLAKEIVYREIVLRPLA